jgi:hypothetical protein
MKQCILAKADHGRIGSGVDLISEYLPSGRLWYGEPDAVSDAIEYAKFYSRSYQAVIRVYDSVGQRDRRARARGGF